MKKIIFALIVAIASSSTAQAMTINVTTDIHAGSPKKRDYTKYTAGNVIYPKKGTKHFNNFLASPADIYIALGDNTNTCKDWKYAKKLRSAVDKSGKVVLFGFGNHDCDKGFKYLHQGSKYYTYDKGNVRVIVLNTEELYNNIGGQNEGGMSGTQIEWLKTQLDTEKRIVIAMSKPAYHKDLKTPKDAYRPFFEAIKGKDNIEHIFAGDYHVFNAVVAYLGYPNIRWHYVPALTLQASPGFFQQIEM